MARIRAQYFAFLAFLLAGSVAGISGCSGPRRSGGPGGSGPSVGGASDGGGGPIDPGSGMVPACQTTAASALPAAAPADIIWVIDNSASMSEEEGYVQSNMNSFSQQIAQSGTNYRVIMITDTANVVVPPPLGGSADFLAVNQNVQSHDAFDKFFLTYPQWQGFLRQGAVKHIVIVSDDESHMSSAEFQTKLAALTNPGFPNGFILHAIVAENLGQSIPPGPCWDKAETVGAIYLSLQQQTMGVFSSLCQSNWTPVFTALATAVQQASAIPCTFAIPPAPAGQMLDFMQVNLAYTPGGGGGQTYVGYVTSAAGCSATGGWYYDDPVNPTRILTCPTTCQTFSADLSGAVSIAFGCATFIE